MLLLTNLIVMCSVCFLILYHIEVQTFMTTIAKMGHAVIGIFSRVIMRPGNEATSTLTVLLRELLSFHLHMCMINTLSHNII